MWSLGIILVNLTCGRNPWKRASIEDSTFRAYLKNPKFLSSILPLSPELDSILRRIFECDPRRRISIPELRNLILRCPRFTTRSVNAPPTPPPDVQYIQDPNFEATSSPVHPFHQYPAAPYTPPPSSPPALHSISAQYSQLTISSNGSSTSDDDSVFSASSTCSNSSMDEFKTNSRPQGPVYVSPKPPDNFYGTFIPLDPTHKDLVSQQFFHSVQVY